MFTPKAHNPALAAGLILTATAFIAASTLLAKALGTGRLGAIQLGDPMPVFMISFGRYVFAFILISLTAAALRHPVKNIHWPLHAGRTLFGWCGVTLMFAVVTFIPMSDATAISFLNPVFCMILAIPLLGEKVGRWRWSAAFIALLGALILLRPTPDSFQPLALLALGAAMALGAEMILMKRLSRREGPLQILLINNLFGVIIASISASFVWQTPNAAQWLVMAGVGASMATAQTCFVNAMARADASFVAPFGYATLVFAALYDGVVYGVIPDSISIAGAVVILAGAALLAWREGVAARRVQTDSVKRTATDTS
ncbi:MAG: DMT family transporter [Aliishimia sp.]